MRKEARGHFQKGNGKPSEWKIEAITHALSLLGNVRLARTQDENRFKRVIEPLVENEITLTGELLVNLFTVTTNEDGQDVKKKVAFGIITLQKLCLRIWYEDIWHFEKIEKTGIDLIYCFERMPIEIENFSKIILSKSEASQLPLNEDLRLLVEGGPSTGKTTFLVEIASRCVQEKKTVFVLANRTDAVNKLEELLKDKLKNEQVEWMNDAKFRSEKVVRKNKNSQKTWEEQVSQILKNTNVLISKMSGRLVKAAFEIGFEPDVVIIDDADEMNMLQLKAAKKHLFSKTIVIAGDSTTIQDRCEVSSIDMYPPTFFDKVKSSPIDFLQTVLTEQYFCHEFLMIWPNKTFFDNKLTNKGNVKTLLEKYDANNKINIKFRDLYDILTIADTSVIRGTESIATYERKKLDSQRGFVSYYNEAEAKFAIAHYFNLLNLGVPNSQIAIMSHYKAQTDYIKKGFKSHSLGFDVPNVGTLSAFRKRRFEVVIFSLTRNSPSGDIGGMIDPRRFCTAITYASRQFMLIGSSFMLKDCENTSISNLYKLLQVNSIDPRLIRGENFDFDRAHSMHNFGKKRERFQKFISGKEEDVGNCEDYEDYEEYKRDEEWETGKRKFSIDLKMEWKRMKFY